MAAICNFNGFQCCQTVFFKYTEKHQICLICKKAVSMKKYCINTSHIHLCNKYITKFRKPILNFHATTIIYHQNYVKNGSFLRFCNSYVSAQWNCVASWLESALPRCLKVVLFRQKLKKSYAIVNKSKQVYQFKNQEPLFCSPWQMPNFHIAIKSIALVDFTLLSEMKSENPPLHKSSAVMQTTKKCHFWQMDTSRMSAKENKKGKVHVISAKGELKFKMMK